MSVLHVMTPLFGGSHTFVLIILAATPLIRATFKADTTFGGLHFYLAICQETTQASHLQQWK
jgi:hypothetical protein